MKSRTNDQQQPPPNSRLPFGEIAVLTTAMCLIAMASAQGAESAPRAVISDRSHSELIRTLRTKRTAPPFIRAESQLVGLDDRLRWGRYPSIVLRTSPTKKAD